MVVTSYFKNELQSLKKYNYTSNWSMSNCAVKCDSPKNRIQRVALLLIKLRRYYPFIQEIYSCVRRVYPSIEYF